MLSTSRIKTRFADTEALKAVLKMDDTKTHLREFLLEVPDMDRHFLLSALVSMVTSRVQSPSESNETLVEVDFVHHVTNELIEVGFLDEATTDLVYR